MDEIKRYAIVTEEGEYGVGEKYDGSICLWADVIGLLASKEAMRNRIFHLEEALTYVAMKLNKPDKLGCLLLGMCVNGKKNCPSCMFNVEHMEQPH